MNKVLLLLIFLYAKQVKAQIEEFVSYTDSTVTTRYKSVITFGADDNGFTYTENKIYKTNTLIEYKTIIGTISSIDTDSIYYGRAKNRKIWIRFQTIKGESFDYNYSLKVKNKFLKHKQHSIKTYVIELPENKAKAFLKSVW